jgi:CDP-diacylglycerol--glycerol-3-phosphate 3-phosphatidyltransferase
VFWLKSEGDNKKLTTKLTFSTKLSLLRIPLAFLFFVLVWQEQLGWALVVFLVTALSDFVDGYIARKWRTESVLGKIIDPVADRIFIISSFLVVYFGPLKETMSLWVLIVVVLQDIFLGLLGIIIFISKRQAILRVSIPGKIATLFQEIFIPLVLLKNIMDYEFSLLPFELVVATTSLISGSHHLYMWICIWKVGREE